MNLVFFFLAVFHYSVFIISCTVREFENCFPQHPVTPSTIPASTPFTVENILNIYEALILFHCVLSLSLWQSVSARQIHNLSSTLEIFFMFSTDVKEEKNKDA